MQALKQCQKAQLKRLFEQKKDDLLEETKAQMQRLLYDMEAPQQGG